MKIVVFGATGKVGRELTAQALAEGHDVTAFVRSEKANLGPHANLNLHVGDVLDGDDVAAAIADQDAVFVTLGKPLRNKDGLRARGTANVIRAMQSNGPKRLICLSGHGAGESFADLPWLYRWLIMPLILKHPYADHEKQEAHVKASGLDWTLVRPTNLEEGPKSGAYKVNFGEKQPGMRFKITFRDVADFMVKQLADTRFVRAAASISA